MESVGVEPSYLKDPAARTYLECVLVQFHVSVPFGANGTNQTAYRTRGQTPITRKRRGWMFQHLHRSIIHIPYVHSFKRVM